MLEVTTLKDIAALSENFEVECKLAAGSDNGGKLPKDFWKTYSAFSNSYGGEVFLGIKEKKGDFTLHGIKNPKNIQDELWNHLNNPQKTSVNLLKGSHVKEIVIEGKTFIHIHVPRAQRKVKPVFIDGNPLTGTYKRLNSGEGVLFQLTERFGKEFQQLSKLERLVMATAVTEGIVRHSRMMEITTEHTHDLTISFQKLVKQGFLETHGQGRGTTYHLPGAIMLTPDNTFGIVDSLLTVEQSEAETASSAHLNPSSAHLKNDIESSREQRDHYGRLLIQALDEPVIDRIEALSVDFRSKLEGLGKEAQKKRKLDKEKMRTIILSLCKEQYLTLNVLASLLERSPHALRQQYLAPMVKEKLVILAFPVTPTHEKQAYKSAK